MKENCYNFNSYSINGNSIYEGFGIEDYGGGFVWYYTERGEKRNLEYFTSEEAIVEYAYKEILKNKWARTHCIGFTTLKGESVKLETKLQGLGISFLQDEIPYYGPGRPVFRTFVFGCDCNRVIDLKVMYFKKYFKYFLQHKLCKKWLKYKFGATEHKSTVWIFEKVVFQMTLLHKALFR